MRSLPRDGACNSNIAHPRPQYYKREKKMGLDSSLPTSLPTYPYSPTLQLLFSSTISTLMNAISREEFLRAIEVFPRGEIEMPSDYIRFRGLPLNLYFDALLEHTGLGDPRELPDDGRCRGSLLQDLA